MKTEIDEREAELQRRAQERRQKWQAQDLKTRKLGRLKYPYDKQLFLLTVQFRQHSYFFWQFS